MEINKVIIGFGIMVVAIGAAFTSGLFVEKSKHKKALRKEYQEGVEHGLNLAKDIGPRNLKKIFEN